MMRSRFRATVLAGAGALALMSFVPTGAHAQSGGSCLQAPSLLSASEISGFTSDPAGLLSRHSAGGVGLSREVRGLVGSDLSTLGAVLEQASSATPAQRGAIGAGLAQAAQACLVERPDLAEQIQLAVAEADLSEVLTAFLTVAGGVQTAQLAPGGLGGPGGPTGPGAIGATGPGSLGSTDGGNTGTVNEGGALALTRGGFAAAGSRTSTPNFANFFNGPNGGNENGAANGNGFTFNLNQAFLFQGPFGTLSFAQALSFSGAGGTTVNFNQAIVFAVGVSPTQLAVSL